MTGEELRGHAANFRVIGGMGAAPLIMEQAAGTIDYLMRQSEEDIRVGVASTNRINELAREVERLKAIGVMCFQLNASQQRTDRHPFTCGNNSRHRNLIATLDGWMCADCNYRQPYGHPAEAYREATEKSQPETSAQ